MINNLIEFLSSYGKLSKSSIEILIKHNIIKHFNKNDVLLKEGQYATECFFVLKGCLRSYYYLDGDEKTTAFFIEKEAITPVSYTTNKPSKYFIACLENSIVTVGNKTLTKNILSKYPEINQLFININEQQLASSRESLDDYINLSPENRFKKLVDERPELIQRVPQYHLASYLGIKPQSLSRIKKRILKNT